MAPHGEAIVSSYARNCNFSKPPRLSNDNLQRTKSDMSFEIRKELETAELTSLPPISEVEDTECECCGMSEECTPEYIERVRKKYLGKMLCGLCAEAVKGEVEKNGGRKEEALNAHMNACAKFKKIRASPALFQAHAMREILRKSAVRSKSLSPRDKEGQKKHGITRSSSCIPAITRDMNGLQLTS